MATKYVPPHRRGTYTPSTPIDTEHHKNSNQHDEVSRPKDKVKPEQAPEVIKGEIHHVNVVPEAIVVDPKHKDMWPRERALFKNLAGIRIFHTRKGYETEYNHWTEHYDEELRLMYEQCVSPELLISYQQFVRLAYVHSDGIQPKYP